ncbi:MAG: excinuclease ABC subunit UvrC [Thioalkalispiraceae bacterium]|jgi:excinuclease ABC subunit C
MTQQSSFDPKPFLKTVPRQPGVYRMLDADGVVIYVGKAKVLKNRLSSYFQKNLDSPKTRLLVSKIDRVEYTVTNTENEALLLENNLIKQLKPRYNILYRDDKSYPYIYLSNDPFPRITLHRGAQRKKGRYFGPYPSAGAVRETLNLLQKLFRIRQCEDSFFKNRSRPCLQYQIKRCTAPCVGLVSEEDYREDIRHAVMFLEGKSSQVIDELVKRMDSASNSLNFEQAALFRDQIVSLRHVQEKQYISSGSGDIDIIEAICLSGLCGIQLFSIRGGHNLGNKSYFPKQAELESDDLGALVERFIAQHYLHANSTISTRLIPEEILLSIKLENKALLEQVLAQQASHKVKLTVPSRGRKLKWQQMAQQNARQAIQTRLNSQATVLQRFEALREVFDLDEMPQRLECFDISHTQGEATVASCVVFDTQGAVKADYRRFNITGITEGDDYAAMHQALTRRFKRLKNGEGKRPDILFIDGGKGQLSQAREVLESLALDNIFMIGVAKGPERKAGEETLILSDPLSGQYREIILPADSTALHLIQQIRDESHRFAITGHRQRRQKARNTSVLETIPGLGAKRRQKLLQQFGGLQEVARAGVDDLASVNGISRQLAQQIYDVFHADVN